MSAQSAMSTDKTLTVLVVFGSVRRDRAGIGLARALARIVTERGHRAHLADPAEIALPMLDRMYKEFDPGTAPEPMERLAGMIREADAVIVVSAEYNHAVPPAMVNLLDHFLEEWAGKPCGISTYSAGRFGGVRALATLRMMLAELGMPTMPTVLPVPMIGKAVTSEGELTDERLEHSVDRFLGELEWWAHAARAHRDATAYPH
ncbi:NADPH-dependent FMN reductase [uncultured Jannaschia sp.]|uniref:NADPH-dependent FMN reductase n=1 Tax=uncultured Jannaschia sp. TaxID=293347 RepID=UPI00260CF1BF|nr:NAD(P)H-dependent oxidoreductase [uncultured Jannaschia sp.]